MIYVNKTENRITLKIGIIIKETVETTDDLIGNKITGISKNSDTVTNENDKQISKKRYISLEKRQKSIDNLDLI